MIKQLSFLFQGQHYILKDSYNLFNVDDICNLTERSYPKYYKKQEKLHLRF
jgi:hypothetical protein